MPRRRAKTFPVVDGARYAVPGDHARVDADGTIVVLGRGSVSINSGGEKIYPEEVEKALKHHPGGVRRRRRRHAQRALRRAGHRRRADARRRDARAATSSTEFAAQHLARYKLPRAIVFVDEMVRSPSGKADYRWAKKLALEKLGIS